MSFNIFERSRARAKPINLFFFRHGAQTASYFAYTDAERPITFNIGSPEGDVTFQPVPIKRSAYAATGNLDKSAMTVQLPQTTDLSELFRIYPPPQTVQLRIYRGSVNDPDNDYVVYWRGRVLAYTRAAGIAKLDCRTVTTSLQRTGLQRNYQYQCPYQLYGTQCKADEAAATVTNVVELVDAGRITLPVGWVDEANAEQYIGGKAQWTRLDGELEIRTILTVQLINNRVFLLAGITRGLTAGDTVTLIRGCDHHMTGCRLHDNILNFGGQPFIPEKNPIGLENIF